MFTDKLLKEQELKEKLTVYKGVCKNCRYHVPRTDGRVICAKYGMNCDKNNTCKAYEEEKK